MRFHLDYLYALGIDYSVLEEHEADEEFIYFTQDEYRLFKLLHKTDLLNIDSFSCAYSDIKELPDDLVINGNLDLNHTNNILSLPKNLQVKGQCWLGWSSITKLPRDINVDFEIYVRQNQLKYIPNRLTHKIRFID